MPVRFSRAGTVKVMVTPETDSIEAGMTRLAMDAHSGFAFVRIKDSWH
jgi:hypothetical protein